MLVLFIAFRLLLAGVFALAALTKLRDRSRTRIDFEAFGLPVWITPALSVCVPGVELVTCVLLLIEPLAVFGAACAFGLLVIFTAVIGINLWRGRTPACACFGSLTHARIGPATLARNGGLLAVAGALMLPPPSAAPGGFELSPSGIWTGALVLTGCVVLLSIWWTYQVWRQHGRMLARIEQLEKHAHLSVAAAPKAVSLARPSELAGQPAPALTLYDVNDAQINLHGLRGMPTVLLFLDAACKHCRPVLARVRTWSPAAHVIVIVVGQNTDSGLHVIDVAPGSRIVARAAQDAMQAFGIMSTPAAIMIDASGIVSGPAARGNAAVTQLMDRVNEAPKEARHEFATV